MKLQLETCVTASLQATRIPPPLNHAVLLMKLHPDISVDVTNDPPAPEFCETLSETSWSVNVALCNATGVFKHILNSELAILNPMLEKRKDAKEFEKETFEYNLCPGLDVCGT